MAAKRGRKQARRKDEPTIPGYLWLLIGLLVGAAVAVTVWVRMPHAVDDLLPHPNPAAKAPAVSNASGVPDGNPPPATSAPKKPKYDFYTLLPEREVVIPDEELSAQVKAEAAASLASKQQAALATDVTSSPASTSGPTHPSAMIPSSANPATTPAIQAAGVADTHSASSSSATAHAANVAPAAVAATIPVPAAQLRSGQYLLQAGAFRNDRQADDLKARIAMLGLVGRVETVQTPAGEMHRVRLGPYATASELETAKQKLGNGGLPAVAIRVK